MTQPILPFASFTTMSLVVSLGAGCRVDSAAKLDIDQRLSVMAPSGQVFAAPATVVPKPLAPGQWTQYKLTNDKGEPSLLTYKIVGEDGGAYWFEIANESYRGKTVMKILLSVPDRGNPNTMEIRVAKTKDKNGDVSELDGPMMQKTRPTYQAWINMLAVSWQGLPREKVNVIAGHFTDCFKARTDATWGAWHATSTTWMHATVPISGLVKSTGIDRRVSVELVGFGEMGATSEIP